MRLHLHLQSPPGEPTRQQLNAVCAVLQADNEMWMQGRKNSRLFTPHCAKTAGVRYVPTTGMAKNSPDQEFLSAPFLLSRLTGSCCDIAPYDAASLRVFFGVDAKAIIVPQGGTSYHCNVLTPWGIYDPTHWWDNANYVLPDPSHPQALQQIGALLGRR